MVKIRLVWHFHPKTVGNPGASTCLCGADGGVVL